MSYGHLKMIHAFFFLTLIYKWDNFYKLCIALCDSNYYVKKSFTCMCVYTLLQETLCFLSCSVLRFWQGGLAGWKRTSYLSYLQPSVNLITHTCHMLQMEKSI